MNVQLHLPGCCSNLDVYLILALFLLLWVKNCPFLKTLFFIELVGSVKTEAGFPSSSRQALAISAISSRAAVVVGFPINPVP